MSEIPCEHACAILLYLSENAFDFVNDMFKYPTKQLVYSGEFCGIKTLDMPKVNKDGVV